MLSRWRSSLGQRTRRVLSHVALGLVTKLLAVGLSFLAMPMLLSALGAPAMGIWLVLFSLFQWLTFFDLGITAGARNEIARCLASGSSEGVERAISTGWLYAALIATAMLLLLAAALLLTPLTELLSRHLFAGAEFESALWWVLLFACLGFVLSFVQHIYAAFEKAAAFSVFSLLVNLFFLAVLAGLWLSGVATVARVASAYGLCLAAANLVLLIAFARRDRRVLPRRDRIDHGLRSRLLGFGLRIFVIQIAALILFATDRVLVSWLLGPAAVVPYDAAFKLFSLITMAHGLVMTTLWSSFTHAYEAADWAWIHKTIKVLLLLMLPVAAGSVILAAVAPALVGAWLGEAQVSKPALYGWFAAFCILFCWSNTFAGFVNGIGETRVQLYSAIAAALVNIPASIYFVRVLDQGLAGVMMGTVVSLLFFSVLGPLQVFSVLSRGRRLQSPAL